MTEVRMKVLEVTLFGTRRHIGNFPTSAHTDLLSIIEMYRRLAIRGRTPNAKRFKTLPAERMDVVDAILLQHGEAPLNSLEGLKTAIAEWKDQTEFDANAYYDAERAEAYTAANTVAQNRLGRRCAELAGVKKNALVLDVACGSGLSCQAACDTGAGFVIGFDAAAKMLELASRNKCDVLRCDFRQPLPFRDQAFDATISVGALHYIADQRSCVERLVGELQRATRGGTCAQLFPPRPDALTPFLEASSEMCIVYDQTHHTTRSRVYLCRGQKSLCQKKCEVYQGEAYCALQYFEENLNPTHREWLRSEHVRKARRIMRQQRHEAKSKDGAPYEGDSEIAKNLWSLFGEVPELEKMYEKVNEVVAVMHGIPSDISES